MEEILKPAYNKETAKKRECEYLEELKKGYPNATVLTIEEYKDIQKDFSHNRLNALEKLVSKSIGSIIKSVAKYYAKHDIEDIVPIEDALEECILCINNRVKDFNVLPDYCSEYTQSCINYLTYVRISRLYNTEKQKTQFVDLYDNATLAYVVDNEKSYNLDTKDIILEDFKQSFQKASKKLTEQEKIVLKLRFGLDGNEEMTCVEIANELGLTRARIHEALVKGLRKLREPAHVKYIKEYSNLNMDL